MCICPICFITICITFARNDVTNCMIVKYHVLAVYSWRSEEKITRDKTWVYVLFLIM